MKKIIVTLSFVLFTLSQVFAGTNEHINHYYSNGESFNFIEGNVHFMVYQNGEFDFFVEQQGVNVDVNIGNVSISYNSGYTYDDYILYDDFGAVIQIEDIPIYYDYYGRISRIGNTYIRYRNRRLIQFGDMYVHYNPYGYYSHCTGYVNYYNRYYNYRPYRHYFARPAFNFCIVSYEPYRRSYHPIRYRYNSDAFRRRARHNSYYRTASNTSSIRRRSIPRRVATKERNTVRRNSLARRNTTSNRSNTVRRKATNNNISSTRKTTVTRSTSVRKLPVRRTNTTNRGTVTRKRNSSVNRSSSTINNRSVRYNKTRTTTRTPSTRSISNRTVKRSTPHKRISSTNRTIKRSRR